MRDRVGIDLLRYAAQLFDSCNETFNQNYSAAELLKIADACQRSEWDYYPTSGHHGRSGRRFAAE